MIQTDFPIFLFDEVEFKPDHWQETGQLSYPDIFPILRQFFS